MKFFFCKASSTHPKKISHEKSRKKMLFWHKINLVKKNRKVLNSQFDKFHIEFDKDKI